MDVKKIYLAHLWAESCANPSKQFTFRQAALDISALLDHLNINQCSAIGFSGGGCTLLHIAYQQAERIKSMAIVSAAPYFPQQTQDIMQQFSAQEKTEEQWSAMRNIHFHGDEQIQMLWNQAGTFSNDDMNFTSEMLSKVKTKTLNPVSSFLLDENIELSRVLK